MNYSKSNFTITGTGAILIIAAQLGACSAAPKLEERPPVSSVEPIIQPVYTLGTVFKQVSSTDGSAIDWEVIEVDENGGYVGRNIAGCSWTKEGDPMSPPIAWDGCGTGEWTSGTNDMTARSGNLWPLAPGNEATWKYKSTSSKGSSSSGSRHCVVTGPFAITAPVGNADTLKVTCKDRWGVSTSYWNAEHGEVRTWRVENEKGLQYDHELVAVERP